MRCTQKIEVTAGSPVRRENLYYREETLPGSPVRRENWSTRPLQAGYLYMLDAIVLFWE